MDYISVKPNRWTLAALIIEHEPTQVYQNKLSNSEPEKKVVR